MSQENVEVVRSIYADWERGDFSATERLHPEIEFAMVGGPSPGTWTGLAGMSEATHEFLSAWEDLRAEPEEYRELDGERVLVLIHHRGRGKTSGLELGQMQTKNAALSTSAIRLRRSSRTDAFLGTVSVVEGVVRILVLAGAMTIWGPRWPQKTSES